MLFDALYENLKMGGWVMWPIFLTGMMGFTVLMDTYFRLGRDLWRGESKAVRQSLELLKDDKSAEALACISKDTGKVAQILKVPFENPSINETALRNLMDEHYQIHIRALDKGLHLVGVLGAVAPLLGLLGTVEGMVRTFQVISVFGNSNPALLSGGISEALVATQSGLLVAFPLILLRQRVVDRVDQLKIQIEQGLQEIYLIFYRKDGQ